jgi:predicted transcriptional regulator
MNRGLNIPKVKDLLTGEIVALQAHFSLNDVVKIFNSYRIYSAPVVNDENEVIGYFSENDSIKSLGNSVFYDEQKNPSIESIMSTVVYTVNPEWDVFELDSFFVSRGIGSAPVIDHNNRLLGVITRRDVIKALGKIVLERADYKKQIKDPVKLSSNQRAKVIIENRLDIH